MTVGKDGSTFTVVKGYFYIKDIYGKFHQVQIQTEAAVVPVRLVTDNSKFEIKIH